MFVALTFIGGLIAFGPVPAVIMAIIAYKMKH